MLSSGSSELLITRLFFAIKSCYNECRELSLLLKTILSCNTKVFIVCFLWKSLADYIECIMVIYIFISVLLIHLVFWIWHNWSCLHIPIFFLIVFRNPEGIYFVLIKSLMRLKKYFYLLLWHFNILDLEISNLGDIKLSLAHSAIVRIICSNFVIHTASTIASFFFLHYVFFPPCCSVLVIICSCWAYHG